MPQDGPPPRARRPVGSRRGVFVDLAMAMSAFGLLVGALFPTVMQLLGVPASVTQRPTFFAATLTAGLVVAAANLTLARLVVGRRVRAMAARMVYVGDVIREAAYTGDWSRCAPDGCALPVDSPDELGHAAAAFNELLEALHTARGVDSTLSAFSASVSAHLSLEVLADVILRGMADCLGADCGVLLGGADRGAIEVLGLPADAVGDAAAGQLDREPVVAQLAADALPDLRAAAGGRADVLLVVPLDMATARVGTVVLGFRQPPPPNVVRLSEVLRRTAAVALTNAVNHGRLRREATTDSLTGIANRRYGLARLQETWEACMREGSPLGVLMFDLDHFKAVNDTYGHHAGDQVLRHVAASSRAALRGDDVIVRTGGEEFVVGLRGADLATVHEVGERLRRAVAASPAVVDGTRVGVTVSVGGASHPQADCASVEQLLRLADAALYDSKRQGRNMLCLRPDLRDAAHGTPRRRTGRRRVSPPPPAAPTPSPDAPTA